MTTPIRTLRAGGFTLIELLTVLVLVSVVATLAAPSFIGYVKMNQAERGRDQLVADLAHARILAMRHGRSVSLCVLPGAEYVIVGGLVDPATCTGTTVLKRVQLRQEYPGINVSGNASSTLSFTFDSRGLSRNASTQLVAVALGSHTTFFRVTSVGTVQPYE